MVSMSDTGNLQRFFPIEESEELHPLKSVPLQKTMASFHKRVLLKRAAARLGEARSSKDRSVRLTKMIARRSIVLGEDKLGCKCDVDTSDSSENVEAIEYGVDTALETRVSLSTAIIVRTGSVTSVESDSDDEPIAYKFPLANKRHKKYLASVKVSPVHRSRPVSDIDSDDIEFGIRYAHVGNDLSESEDERDMTSEEQSGESEEDSHGIAMKYTNKLSLGTQALVNGIKVAHSDT